MPGAWVAERQRRWPWSAPSPTARRPGRRRRLRSGARFGSGRAVRASSGGDPGPPSAAGSQHGHRRRAVGPAGHPAARRLGSCRARRRASSRQTSTSRRGRRGHVELPGTGRTPTARSGRAALVPHQVAAATSPMLSGSATSRCSPGRSGPRSVDGSVTTTQPLWIASRTRTHSRAALSSRCRLTRTLLRASSRHLSSPTRKSGRGPGHRLVRRHEQLGAQPGQRAARRRARMPSRRRVGGAEVGDVDIALDRPAAPQVPARHVTQGEQGAVEPASRQLVERVLRDLEPGTEPAPSARPTPRSPTSPGAPRRRPPCGPATRPARRGRPRSTRGVRRPRRSSRRRRRRPVRGERRR